MRRARPFSRSTRESRFPIGWPPEGLLLLWFRAVSCAAIEIGIRRRVVLVRRFAQRLTESCAAGGAFFLERTVVRPPAHRLDWKIRRHEEIAQAAHRARPS